MLLKGAVIIDTVYFLSEYLDFPLIMKHLYLLTFFLVVELCQTMTIDYS